MKSLRFLLLGIALASVAIFAFCRSLTDIFEAKTYTDKKGESIPYRYLKPQKPEKGKRYPLVLFLHGAGERGDDNISQINNGVKLFASPEALEKYPCFMIVPQCPKGLRWVETDWRLDSHIMPDTISTSLRLALEIMQEIIKNNPVDTNRIYVTGVSMGGFGTWDLLQRYPDKFAAAAPVCGGADETKAGRLINIPIWAFHGGNDKLVKTIRSEHIIEAIRKAGGTPMYTEYPGLGHNAWDSAYHDTRILEWMFARHK